MAESANASDKNNSFSRNVKAGCHAKKQVPTPNRLVAQTPEIRVSQTPEPLASYRRAVVHEPLGTHRTDGSANRGDYPPRRYSESGHSSDAADTYLRSPARLDLSCVPVS